MKKAEQTAAPAEIENRPPYEYLYIYYLIGRAEGAGQFFGPAFIGNWEEDGFSFLFFSEPADGEVRAFLEKHPTLTLTDQYRMTYEEWQGGRIAPMNVGEFYICPPWNCSANNIEYEGNAQGYQILMDPGVVFGTGLHPTTRDCLKAISWLFSRNAMETALDLGTGTGLLSLAAAKLGCKKCLAVDFNLLAAGTALRNVLLNDLDENILVVHGRAENFLTTPADLLIANIHYDVMKKIIQAEGFLQKKWFILSGLFRSQARIIEEELKRTGAEIVKKWEQEYIWHTILCRFVNR